MKESFNIHLESLLSFFIPSFSGDVRKYRTLIYGAWITIGFMLYYILISWIIDFMKGMIICSVVGLVLFTIPFLIRRGISYLILGNLFSCTGIAGITLLSIYTGGIDSPILPWIALVTLVSLLFANRVSAWIWVIISIVVLLIVQQMTYLGMTKNLDYNSSYRPLLFANSYLGLIASLFFLSAIYDFALEKANSKLTEQSKMIFEEKNKSDHLLLNILPEDIASELKSKGYCEARQYGPVSILFTDFVDFTKYSETVTPSNLISELHHYFQFFDDIMEKYGMEKIKTIGDAYMAVCGLPKSDPLHALHTVKAAIEMQEYVYHCYAQSSIGQPIEYKAARFQMKIGIHSGDVIAGIVGTKKFAFDIWGDAVNTAARVMQNTLPNTINLSRNTYDLVKNEINCVARGIISVKSKGQMELFSVVGELKPNHKSVTESSFIAAGMPELK